MKRQAVVSVEAAKLLKEHEEYLKLTYKSVRRHGSYQGWTLHVTGNSSRWVRNPPAQLTFVEMTFVSKDGLDTGRVFVPREPLSL